MLKTAIGCAFVACSTWAAEPPRRIVSTAPSITEMLYALGLGDRVVGVTTYCHYPPEARLKPKIGAYLRPDLEAVVALRPDLVILAGRLTNLAEKLPAFSIPTLELEHQTIAGIYDSLSVIGRRAGAEAAAERRVAAIKKDLDQVHARLAARPKRSAMFIVGRTPGTIQDLIAAGRATFLNELIEIAGGDNIFKDAVAAYPKVAREEVFARRPEVIIDMGEMADTDRVTEEQKKKVVELWNKFSILPAVRSRRVYAVASDIFVVPGPRVAEAARALSRMIHPEAGL